MRVFCTARSSLVQDIMSTCHPSPGREFHDQVEDAWWFSLAGGSCAIQYWTVLGKAISEHCHCSVGPESDDCAKMCLSEKMQRVSGVSPQLAELI